MALTREPEYSPANVVGYTVTTDGGARVDPHDMSWDEARVFLDTLIERDRDAVSAEKKPSRSKPSTRQRR
ncbi:hypothetical protein PQU63_01850 [Xanthomonas protegens]|uniref:hypothetical protein n=1 Tax=Xanthomonas protegens TaxID=3380705 RepID=UPI003884767E